MCEGPAKADPLDPVTAALQPRRVIRLGRPARVEAGPHSDLGSAAERDGVPAMAGGVTHERQRSGHAGRTAPGGRAICRRCHCRTADVDVDDTRTVRSTRTASALAVFAHLGRVDPKKCSKTLPKYYRLGNIVASWGLRGSSGSGSSSERSTCGRVAARWMSAPAPTTSASGRCCANSPTCQSRRSIAARKCSRRGPEPRAEMWRSYRERGIHDVHGELPFADNSFDIVTLQAASRHLQLDKVLPEVRRVLKPGGHFYHCDMLKPSTRIVEWLYVRFLRMSVVAWTRVGVRINRGIQGLLRLLPRCDHQLLHAGRTVRGVSSGRLHQ